MFGNRLAVKNWQVFLLGAVCLLGAVPVCHAQEIKVTLVIILASEKDSGVDKDLKCLAEEIQKKEPKLKSFRLEDTVCKSLTLGKKEDFELVDKEKARVLVRHGADQNDRVSLIVKPPRMGEIDYTTCCGKFFPIVTRYETKDKERLIIAIRVQPCKGNKKNKK